MDQQINSMTNQNVAMQGGPQHPNSEQEKAMIGIKQRNLWALMPLKTGLGKFLARVKDST